MGSSHICDLLIRLELLIHFSNLISAKPFYTRHRNTIKTLTDNIILKVFLRRVGDNLISKLSHRNWNFCLVCNTPYKVVVPHCIWLSLCSVVWVKSMYICMKTFWFSLTQTTMCKRQSGTVSSEFLVQTSNVLSTQKGHWLTLNIFFWVERTGRLTLGPRIWRNCFRPSFAIGHGSLGWD